MCPRELHTIGRQGKAKISCRSTMRHLLLLLFALLPLLALLALLVFPARIVVVSLRSLGALLAHGRLAVPRLEALLLLLVDWVQASQRRQKFHGGERLLAQLLYTPVCQDLRDSGDHVTG